MPIWDWSAKQGVLKCRGCPLVPSIVLERETRCPSSVKQLQAAAALLPAVPYGGETSLGSAMTQQAQVLTSKARSPGGNYKQGCGYSSSLGSREKLI